MTEPDDDTLEAMDRYGGSFVRALAVCYRTADPDNRRKLHRAFAAEFEKYRSISRLGGQQP